MDSVSDDCIIRRDKMVNQNGDEYGNYAMIYGSDIRLISNITDFNDSAIIYDLRQSLNINYICFDLSKYRNDRTRYSYVIKASNDGIEWQTIVDFEQYLCAMNQLISFAPMFVRFITIQSYTRLKNKFTVSDFNVGLSQESVPSNSCGSLIFNRLIFPNKHLYSVSVINRRNGVNQRFYCCPYTISDLCPLVHYIGSGRIVITFNQPMFIHVLQFYLWFSDYRSYCYYVEVSKDLIDWQTVFNTDNTFRSGLQRISINRDIISIRIIGTKVKTDAVDTVGGEQEFRIIQLGFPAESH